MVRLMKKAIEVLYDSKIENDKKVEKITKILYGPKKKKNSIGQ